MQYGLDVLGGAKYGDLLVKEWPSGFSAGFFSNTFGDARPVVDKLLSTGRCPRVRIHLAWHDNHAYSAADTPGAVVEAKKWLPIIAKYPGVEFRISPWCEYIPQSPNDFADCHNTLRQILPPQVAIVNTPLHTANIIPDFITEFHGASKSPDPHAHRYDFSFDGTACVDADVTAYKHNFATAETFYFWDARFNGQWESNDKVPRDQRHGWPDATLLKSIEYLSNIRGAAHLPDKWLYKSHSENKGNGDPRAEKPVFIIPIMGSHVLLKTRDGNTVGSFDYYGNYIDGRFRFYSKDWGFQIASRAVSIQGDALCNVWVGNKNYGSVNPAFRYSEFR